MDKKEQLALFDARADELIDSKYILADIKIVGLLKVIASSETLLALLKSCLNGFDYKGAKKKYLVKSQYLSEDKGEFIMPPSSRELLAFVFNVLMEIDAKTINFSDFLNKYFYEDGSFVSSYINFINSMIKPFKNSVDILMASVIDGKLEDPIDALTKAEEKQAQEKQEQEETKKKELEQSKMTYGKSLKAFKQLLTDLKTKIKDGKLSDGEKTDAVLIIDMLANAIDSGEKDAIVYAYTSYRFMLKAHKILFFGKQGKSQKYYKDIVNGI